MNPITTLIATVGGQPQIVTFALDELRKQRENITCVVLLYLEPRNDRLRQAIHHLKATLNLPPYHQMQVIDRVIHNGRNPIKDIQDDVTSSETWDFVNKTIIEFKEKGHRLHVCSSGGRRILSMLMMSSATLHFQHHDCLWHLYTPDDIQAKTRDGAVMQMPSNSSFPLISVPLMRLGSSFNNLRQVTALPKPLAVMNESEKLRCRQVLQNCSAREEEVLRCFAAGKKPSEVTDELFISTSTLDSHKTKIYAYCREAWALPEDTRLDFHFLHDKFAPFFKQIPPIF